MIIKINTFTTSVAFITFSFYWLSHGLVEILSKIFHFPPIDYPNNGTFVDRASV